MSSEKIYIELCKCKIEKQLVFNIDNSGLKTRDLTYLSKIIHEKSDVTLSLSTLKRLWNENSKTLPQPATLNALVSVLDYIDWQDFKQKNPITSKVNPIKRDYKKKPLFASIIILLLVLIFSAINIFNNKENNIDYMDVPFSADKTLLTGIPNTVIFKYDVSGIDADSFFIQQSWNDRNKVEVDANDSILSSIYFKPGFHRAKLFANNTVVAKQNVHILSNGWIPYISNDLRDIIPQYFDFESHISNGYFSINGDKLEAKGIDINENFILRLNNSRDFGVSEDNFSFKAILKCDSIKPIACPNMSIMLVFEVHVFWIKLVKNGCEHYGAYKIGEVYSDGSKNDLSALGCNIYDWQNVELTAQNKHVQVMLNGQLAIQTSYHNSFGNLVGIIFTFEGLGSVDFVSIGGADGNLVYEDNMD